MMLPRWFALWSKLGEKEIDEALDPKNYLGTAVKQAKVFSENKN
jgi:hypothetical protein